MYVGVQGSSPLCLPCCAVLRTMSGVTMCEVATLCVVHLPLLLRVESQHSNCACHLTELR
jgi:hypothetical protein